jgi:hypothetical protein
LRCSPSDERTYIDISWIDERLDKQPDSYDTHKENRHIKDFPLPMDHLSPFFFFVLIIARFVGGRKGDFSRASKTFFNVYNVKTDLNTSMSLSSLTGLSSSSASSLETHTE